MAVEPYSLMQLNLVHPIGRIRFEMPGFGRAVLDVIVEKIQSFRNGASGMPLALSNVPR